MDIDDLDKSIKKRGWLRTILFVIIIFIFITATSFTSGYFGGKIYFESKVTQNVTTSLTANIETPNSEKPQILVDEDKLGVQVGEFKEEEWEINQRRVSKEKDENGNFTGFYCIMDSKSFDSGEIWYKNKIRTNTAVVLRYQLKSLNLKTIPGLIFLYGENRDFRMFISGSDPKYIEFEEKENPKKHKPKKLPEVIDTTKEGEVQVNIGSSAPNQANIGFTLKYIPNTAEEDKREVSFSDSFTTRFPWPNPDSEGATQKIGFGAFNGNCLKPTYFKLI